MANKISTVRTYPLNGAVDFTITFEYLARKFVKVTLIGKDRKELVLNQDYRFTTKTQITTSRAWTAADGYQMIEIRRFTSASDRLVDFADGSILRAYDLNISQIQTLHVAEEARDLTADTIGVNNDGNLDARGRKIVNVGEATEAGDAVNLGQLQKWNDSALNSARKAEAQATKAEQQANYSFSYADQSKSAATASAKSAEASQLSNANSLEWSKRSEASAVRSQNSASESFNSASLARMWASLPKDNVVADGLGSAYHYMLYSKSYMESSQASAVTAKNEADRATTEADKLGNWNALAGTVQDVVDKDVSWYGAHTAKEFRAVGPDGFRLINGDYGALFRNDGTNLYLLLTDKGSPLGGFNSLRPFNVNLASGIPSFPQGGVFSGAVTVFRPAGPQLVVDSQTNQASYILGQTGNRNSWYVGKGNAGSPEVGLHSYDLDTSILLKSDHIAFSKPLNVNGEVRTMNSALQNDGDIRGGRWGGGALSATIHRNRGMHQKVFSGTWLQGQTVTFTDATIDRQFLIIGVSTSTGIEYVSVCTPSAGATFWVNVGNWSYRLGISPDGWRSTMHGSQDSSGGATAGAIAEVYVVRTDLG